MSFLLGGILFDDDQGFAQKDALRFRLGAEQMAVLQAFAQNGGRLNDQKILEQQWLQSGGRDLSGAEIMASMEDTLHPILGNGPLFKTDHKGQILLNAPVELVEARRNQKNGLFMPAMIAWGVILCLALIEAYIVFTDPKSGDEVAMEEALPIVLDISMDTAADTSMQDFLTRLNEALEQAVSLEPMPVKEDTAHLELTGRITQSEMQALPALSLKLKKQPDAQLIWAGFYPLEGQDQQSLINWIVADISSYLS